MRRYDAARPHVDKTALPVVVICSTVPATVLLCYWHVFSLYMAPKRGIKGLYKGYTEGIKGVHKGYTSGIKGA